MFLGTVVPAQAATTTAPAPAAATQGDVQQAVPAQPGEGEQPGQPEPAETVVGVYTVIAVVPSADAPADAEHELHFLETPDGTRYELSGDLEQLAALVPGQEIAVTGVVDATGPSTAPELSVRSAEPAPGSPASTTPVATPIERSNHIPGPKKTAVILLREGPTGTVTATVAGARQAYFTATDSAGAYIAEASWGQTTLVGRDNPTQGDVYGVLTIPANTACHQEGEQGMIAAAAAGIDTSTYDLVSFVIHPSAAQDCGYAGYANLGGKVSVNMTPMETVGRGLVVHEFGHNLGLEHASSIACLDPNGAAVSLRIEQLNCTHAEYGDPFDPMGNPSYMLQYNAVHKARLGWAPMSTIQTVTAAGDYYIYPNHVQGQVTRALEIPRPGEDGSLFVDFRQPGPGLGEAQVANFPALLNGVTIRQLDRYKRKLSLVDTKPATVDRHDAPLQVGQSITDPSTGITLTTVAVSSTRATVRVAYPAAAFPQVYLRGTHNNWTLSTPMTKDPGTHGVWRAVATFGAAANQRFKFDVAGDWTENYGDTNGDGVVERTGGDIAIPAAGTYSVVYHQATGRYWVTRPPIANAGPDITVPANTLVLLNSGASTTQEGRPIVRREWTCCRGIGVPDISPSISEVSGSVMIPTPGVYEASLRVFDDRGEWTRDTLTITVPDDAPPVPVPGADVTVEVGQPVTLDGSASYDDGTIVSYEWACCRMSYGQWDRFRVATPTVTHTFTALGTYTPRLTVTDDLGQVRSANVTVTVVAPAQNLAPIANAGADQTVTAGSTVTLTGFGSYDMDGSISSYAWSGAGVTGTGPVWTGQFPTPGVYPITLTVTDDDGATGTDTVVVTVTPVVVNQPPVADAGPARSVVAGSTVTLSGSASYDPDGSIVSYVWRLYGVSSTGLTWTGVFPSPGSYPVQLIVTDDQGATAITQVTITVTPAPFTSVYPQVYLRGTHNAWGTTTPMTLVGNNTWRATVTFGATSTERFKFDVHGNWATNFGDNAPRNGVADASGADIPITGGAGQYTITFNDSTKAYTVTKL